MRDRTLLLVGWNSALRRTNLAALTWDQFTRVPAGWVVYIAKSKTDQEGHGTTVGIPRAPEGSDLPDAAVAVDRWLAHVSGVLGADPRRLKGIPVFPRVDRYGRLMLLGGRPVALSGSAVSDVVQQWVEAAGLTRRNLVTTGGMRPREDRNPFGAHSLRAGWITEAKRHDVPDNDIMQQTGHRSARSIAPYYRPARRPEILAAAEVLAGINATVNRREDGPDTTTRARPRRQRGIAW